jgi:hypothetical protein
MRQALARPLDPSTLAAHAQAFSTERFETGVRALVTETCSAAPAC